VAAAAASERSSKVCVRPKSNTDRSSANATLPLQRSSHLAGSLAAGVVLAQSGSEVLMTKGCLNRHEADKKGRPAMKDIAAKHKAGDEAALVAKIKERIRKLRGPTPS